MPRPLRTLEEGSVYHIYNRVGGEGVPFVEKSLASRFVDVLQKVVDRDDLVVFAWVLMSNHYHLVALIGAVPLSRSIKSLQQEVTKSRNRWDQVRGPMWQGRFKAKQVDLQEYLEQLIAYVHLNPVKAGIVERPEQYQWSGHPEILGDRRRSVVAVDDVLSIYGTSRRQALRRYRLAVRDVNQSDWSGEAPGRLPWWRRGRPSAGDTLSPKGRVMVDELGRPTSPYRARFEAEIWVELTCRHFGVGRDQLSSRQRRPEIIRIRELVGLIGVERYGVKVKDLAAVLGKSEDGVSLWVRRGTQRRAEDRSFAAEAQMLDEAFQEER